jgi:hypothetical protein
VEHWLRTSSTSTLQYNAMQCTARRSPGVSYGHIGLAPALIPGQLHASLQHTTRQLTTDSLSHTHTHTHILTDSFTTRTHTHTHTHTHNAVALTSLQSSRRRPSSRRSFSKAWRISATHTHTHTRHNIRVRQLGSGAVTLAHSLTHLPASCEGVSRLFFSILEVPGVRQCGASDPDD